MEKDKANWLNEYGELYWYKKSDMTITAHRAYHWVDRVIFIKESKIIWCDPSELIPYGHYTTTGRHYLEETSYIKFKEQIGDWIPIINFDNYILRRIRKEKLNKLRK